MRENKYVITTEEQLQSFNYQKSISDFYNLSSGGFFEGEKGIKIYYKYFLQNDLDVENGAILISNGRRENSLKYKELIYDLYQNGYSVYICDHRGQGFSERINKTDKKMGHIDKFEYYVDDLKYYFENFVKEHNHKRIFLLAHSMGAAIGTRYIQEYTNDFIAAAFSSPMFGLNFPICELIRLFSIDKPGYALGQKKNEEEEKNFKVNNLTHSRIRYELLRKVYEENPSIKICGASYKWIYQSCITFKKIFKNLQKIETPIILVQAGKDKIVSSNAQNKFVYKLKKLRKNVQGFISDGADHEILIEKDEYRIPLITNVLDFFASV